jgi:hypothetical protein
MDSEIQEAGADRSPANQALIAARRDVRTPRTSGAGSPRGGRDDSIHDQTPSHWNGSICRGCKPIARLRAKELPL